MSANDTQVGGTHYKDFEYQHWDFAIDVELPWPIACATKYICRWRNKNGVEDLGKAVHYLEKAIERGVRNRFNDYSDLSVTSFQRMQHRKLWYRFIEQIPHSDDQFLMHMLWSNAFETAIQVINYTIKQEQTKAEELKNEN